MRKKILIVLQDFRGGGAERVAVLLANGLSNLNIEIKIIALDVSGPMRKGLNKNITVEELACRRVIQSPLAIARHISNFRPDWVMSHMTHVNVAVLIAKFLTSWRPKYIVIEHNHIHKNIVHKSWLVRSSYYSTRLFYRFANGLVCVSDGVARSIAGFTGIKSDKITVIHNPVIDQTLITLANQRPMPTGTHKFFLANKKVIIAVGSLTLQKGYMALLEAFKEVQKNCDCYLLILGEGDQRAVLEKRIAELELSSVVDLPGFCKAPYLMMQNADLYVLSSLWEGLPTVLIEALLFCKNIVATDCVSGPREILKGGMYGRLVEPGNEKALQQAIEEELSACVLREGMRNRALDFSVVSASKKYKDFLEGL